MPQCREAFVYCWTDHKTNKLYVGYHKGQQDDGYICSSKWMLEEYKKRPEDFTRMILAEGTAEDCHALEIAILKAADAKHSDRFYNQSDGSSADFVCKGHTEKTREKMSKARKGKKQNFTKETIELLSFNASERFKGKKLTKEHKEAIGLPQKGKPRGCSVTQKNAMKKAHSAPVTRQKHREAMLKRLSVPEEREKNIQHIMFLATDEKIKSKRAKSRTEYFKMHPEAREKQSKNAKKQWEKRKAMGKNFL